MKKFIMVLIGLVGISVVFKVNAKEKDYKYVITETPMSNSLDPLDADMTINMPVARMVYATPIHVGTDGKLTSSVLDSFVFEKEKNRIIFKLKAGLNYSDQTEITIDDLAFAISRMVFTRPDFPVIEDIKGIKEWKSSPEPLATLPSGLRIDGNSLFIEFGKKIDHPLYRFCLELFSIIPKSCVNLTTNKMICSDPPKSGFYEIIKRDSTAIEFRKRDESSKLPKNIKFEYISPKAVSTILKDIDENTVVSGADVHFSTEDLDKVSGSLDVVFAPSSRIVGMLINPKSKPFDDKKCRLYFAHAFRETFADKVKNNFKYESSLFTDILPGYVSSVDFEKEFKLSDSEIKNCKEAFAKYPVKWLKAKSHADSIFVKVMESVFNKMEVVAPAPLESDDMSSAGKLFLDGDITVVSYQSGFWALDPGGDAQMLFTPGFAQPLNFVTSDSKFIELIRGLNSTSNKSEAYKQANKYFYSEALFNIYSHSRRFFAAKNKEMISESPSSITAPAPWQVFKH